MSCAICLQRKEKRFCPAIHGRICPQCCGEQRELTLDCPSDCPYLQQARQHEGLRELHHLPAEEVFPKVQISDEFLDRREPLIEGILHAIGNLSRQDRSMNDREVIAALTTMTQSYQILAGSGLVYEQASPSLAQQAITETLRRLLQDYRQVEQEHLGRSSLTDGEALKALVFTLRLALTHTSGRPRSRRFLDFLRETFPASPGGPTATPSSRIFMP